MKTVLLISFFFPPAGGMATQRVLRFARKLPAFGWIPYVLAPHDSSSTWFADNSLEGRLPEKAVVRRISSFDLMTPARFLRSKRKYGKIALYLERIANAVPPEPQVGWFPFAYRAAKKILERYQVDAVYSSSPPATTHLVACWLKKQTGVPWVAEFRDEWATHPSQKVRFQYTWQRRIDDWLEQTVVRTADHIVLASPAYRALLEHHLALNKVGRFTAITNGFDRNELRSVSESADDNKFTIVHTGTFYPWLHPGNFLTAVEGLISDGTISIDKLRLVFAGRGSEEVLKEFVRRSLGTTIECYGRVSHSQALALQSMADVLLLILSPERGQETIPGKVFEYLMHGKPILALVPPKSVMADILRKTRASVLADAGDVEATKECLRRLYAHWANDTSCVEPDWQEINKYDVVNLTGKLASVLDSVLSLQKVS